MPSNVKQPSSRKTYMDDNKIDNSDTNNIKMKHCNTKTEIYTRKQNKGVKIGHLNIRSLLKKIDEIRILIHQNSFDILAISETWLSDKIPNELVNIPGFNVYRNDRPSHGGGVLIYIIVQISPILIILKWSGSGLIINLPLLFMYHVYITPKRTSTNAC